MYYLKTGMSIHEKQTASFIKDVENHPCLYNTKIPSYAQRSAADRAWQKIGQKYDMTVDECKVKWKNIRTAFARKVAITPNEYGKRKPYYLHDLMRFMIPFMKFGKRRMANRSLPENRPVDPIDTIPKVEFEYQIVTEPADNDQYDEDNVNPQNSMASPDHSTTEFNQLEDNVEHREPTRGETAAAAAAPAAAADDDIDRMFLKYLKRKYSHLETNDEDPKRLYLLSLIPDISDFSNEEMRSFKMKTMNIINDIILSRESS